MSDVKATKNVPVIMPQDLWDRIEAEAKALGVTTDTVIVGCMEACLATSVKMPMPSPEEMEEFFAGLPSWANDVELHPFQADRYRKDDMASMPKFTGNFSQLRAQICNSPVFVSPAEHLNRVREGMEKVTRLGLSFSQGTHLFTERSLEDVATKPLPKMVALTVPGSLEWDEDTAPTIKIPPALRQGDQP